MGSNLVVGWGFFVGFFIYTSRLLQPVSTGPYTVSYFRVKLTIENRVTLGY